MPKINVHVVIQTAFIGDLFLSIPTLRRLKLTYPEHELILICKKGLGSFFLKNHIVDHVFEVQKGNAASYKQVLQKIREFKVDHVYCLHRSLRSALFTWQIQANEKIGFGHFFHYLFFSKVVAYPLSWPDAVRQLSLLKPIDEKVKSEIEKADWTYLNFKNTDGTFEAIPDFFKIHSGSGRRPSTKKIALFPGSVWATKRWTMEGYTEVARALIEKGFTVYLMGGADEIDVCKTIHHQVPGSVICAGSMTLAESIEQIKNCDLIVCNDSAPSHMAASVGTPVVCILGPTTVDLGFRPWIDHSKVIENSNLLCRPCGKHGHQLCPLGHHKCMKDIPASQVLAAIDQMVHLYPSE